MTHEELLEKIEEARRTEATTLVLSGNGLTTLPEQITELTSLQGLSLNNNQLTTLPEQITKLTNLRNLRLSSNRITVFPTEITKLTSLEYLSLSDNQLMTLPTEIAKLTSLEYLSLSNNQLKTLPTEIANLTSLHTLWIEGNRLTTFPNEIMKLALLQKLSLNNNQLTTLPEQITQLTSLQELYLDNNQLKTLPEQITKLTSLQELYLDNNQLKTLPEQITKLTNLRNLRLSSNRITVFPTEITKLTSLEHLSLSNNQLMTLPTEIAKLTSLEYLSLSNNQLKTLPTEIANLTSLHTLWIEGNRLTTFPNEIMKLVLLQKLSLANNQLTTLPEQITQLTSLKELYLDKNQLTTLPTEIAKLTSLQRFDLRGNSLPLPSEILAKVDSAQEILAYYAQTLVEETLPVNEVKMLFVGQGFAGKTSLAKVLKTGKADPHERKTDGIWRERWKPEGTEVTANIWDFGGQEIMHHTHQFFLTERSLYLLVLNSRQTEEENRVEYWLKLIQTFGGSAPVLVIINKAEEHPLQLNESGLKKKYPDIKGFYRTSACPETGEPQGIEELKRAICAEIEAIKAVRDGLPASCFAVKQALEEMQDDFITQQEFQALCHAKEVPARLHDTLLNLLNDLGTVLNYRQHRHFDLAETNVLNPEWVTNGVYAILNHLHQLAEKQGVLHTSMLSKLLSASRYPVNRHRFLLGMMEEFQICYKINEREYLLPDLLSPQEPDTGRWDDKLMFEYHYEVALPLIMTRFTVLMSKYISQDTCWKTGVLLKYERSNRALVRADWEEKRIVVWIEGNPAQRRSFLAIIREQFRTIHSIFDSPVYTERVPIPGFAVSVDYQHLLTLERANIREQIFEGMAAPYSVQDLLNGVVDLDTRRDERDLPAPRDRRENLPVPVPVPNPWLSGSFYLVAFLMTIAACALVAKFVSGIAVIPVFIASLLAVGGIGALQLKQDDLLSEKGFLSLMAETYKQFPLLSKGKAQKQAASGKGANDETKIAAKKR